MAKKAGFSVTTPAKAASGERLPSPSAGVSARFQSRSSMSR
ncbi:hypothetical protein [Streptomyces neyagawaensis]